jgi:hypothetical protein
MTIAEEYKFLMLEAGLAAQTSCNGLTLLSKYNFAEKGYFYSGMFGVCIGLERIMKIIEIMRHRIENSGSYPTNDYLKRVIGHKISNLLQRTKEVNTLLGLGVNDDMSSDPLFTKIVDFLTEFAMKSRYYNLDTLTGQTGLGDEPLARWNKDICSELLARHFRMTKRKAIMIAMASRMGDHSVVLHTDEEGKEITTIDSMAENSIIVTDKQRYTRLYLFKIFRFITGVLSRIERKLPEASFIHEYFVLFDGQPDKMAINKVKWDNYRI